MNIFDPHISGSLSVSGSGEISGDLRVLGTINATISGTTTNALTASEAPKYTLTSSFGSFTSSYTTGSFTGSFIGDGSGLTNIPASGVTGLNLTQIADGSVTASVSNSNGLRVNSNTEITGSLTVTGDIVGSVDFDTLRNKPTLVSGSSQINISGTTGYSLLSSSISTIVLNQSNRIASVEGKTGSFATTGSNIFIGTQTHSGSIIPSVDNEYDLGSVTHQWRDVYISSGSLYIDGTKVISSDAQELQITTDNGQSIKILEGGTDSIILQTADGNIELKSNADGDILLDPTNGKIMLKGPVEILNGQKIQSSVGGTPVVFANDIVVSGSIDITGTIEGINLTDFSSSVNTRISTLETTTGNLSSYNSSNTTNINAIHTATSSLNEFTTSINTTIKSKLNTDGVISGSSQVIITGTTGYSTFSSSVSTSIGLLSSSVATTTNELSSTITSLSSSLTSSIGSLSSSIATTTSGLSSTINSLSSSLTSSVGQLSSSIAITTSGLSTSITNLSSSNATTDLNQTNRLVSLEGKSGSYATTGSNNFIGDQTITGSLYISQNLIVQGSSSLENITASAVSIGTNIIVLNTDTPAFRYAGVSVFDSGSTNITASLLYDSLENQWKFKHSDVGTNDASILLFGPLGNDIDNTPLLAGNYLTKVENNGHGHHITTSSILDNGSKVSINSNTEITGTFVATGTALVSGSSQVSFNGITDKPTIVSGSAQVSFNGITDRPTLVSGSSQITYGGLTGIPSGIISGAAQLPSGVVSGSSQVLSGTGIFSSSVQLPSGLVSGSSQVLAGTTIHSGSFFNGITVVSGSAQISFNGITDRPTLVSGSSQITYGSISGIPSGIVSGSSQVSYPSLSNIPGGIVSGSSQIDLTATTNYSTGIKTRLNAEGVVSGSSQITLSSTTGYGSVLNQAVLTTSTPTFAGLTLGTEFTSNDANGYSRFTEGNGSAQVGLFRSGTSSGGVYIGGDSDSFRIYTANFGSVLMSVSQSTGAISGASFTGAGTGLTGTASSLSIGGNAATATNSTQFNGLNFNGLGTRFTGNINTLGLASTSGIYNIGDGYTNGPGSTTLYGTLFGIWNSDISTQFWASYNGDFYWRKSIGGSYVNAPWRTILDSANYNTYSPTLTGTGASGTWGISISGNAGSVTYLQNRTDSAAYPILWGAAFTNGIGTIAYSCAAVTIQSSTGTITANTFSGALNGNATTATNATNATTSTFVASPDGDRVAGNKLPTSNPRTVRFDFATAGSVGGAGNYAGVMTYSPWDGTSASTGDSSYQLVFANQSGVNASGPAQLLLRNGINSTWNSFQTILSSTNFNSYALPLTGGQLNGKVSLTDAAYFTGSPTGGFRFNSGNDTFNNVIFSDNGNVSTRGSLIVGNVIGTAQARMQVVGAMRWSTGGNSYFTETDMDGGGLYIETVDNNTSRAKMRFQTRVNNSGNYTSYQIDANNNQHFWVINGSTRLTMNSSGDLLPGANGTQNIGSASLRWNTVFTSDLSLSNGIGDYTIVEGEEKLYLYNNKNNKVYSFVLQEEDPTTATPKKIH